MIAAEGEHKASRSLRLAAEVIADSPAALQVGKPTNFLRFSKFVSFSDAVSSNVEQHLGRKQQHHHIPGDNPTNYHIIITHQKSKKSFAEKVYKFII